VRALVTSEPEAKVVPMPAAGNVRARLEAFVALSTWAVRQLCHTLWGTDPAHLHWKVARRVIQQARAPCVGSDAPRKASSTVGWKLS